MAFDAIVNVNIFDNLNFSVLTTDALRTDINEKPKSITIKTYWTIAK